MNSIKYGVDSKDKVFEGNDPTIDPTIISREKFGTRLFKALTRPLIDTTLLKNSLLKIALQNRVATMKMNSQVQTKKRY